MVLSTKINPGGLGGHGNKAECARVTRGGQHSSSCALHLNLFHHTAETSQATAGDKGVGQQAERGLNPLVAVKEALRSLSETYAWSLLALIKRAGAGNGAG